jgi:hypothetical protein
MIVWFLSKACIYEESRKKTVIPLSPVEETIIEMPET